MSTDRVTQAVPKATEEDTGKLKRAIGPGLLLFFPAFLPQQSGGETMRGLKC